MANLLYDPARAAFAQAQLNWVSNNFSVVLLDLNQYTFNAAHTGLDQVAPIARIGTAALTGKTVSSTGGCRASPSSVAASAGALIGGVLVYLASGVESTSTLVCYLDALIGLPYTTTGTPVFVAWNNGNSGIFRL